MGTRREIYGGYAAQVRVNQDALYDCPDKYLADDIEYNLSECAYDSVEGAYLGRYKRYSESASVSELNSVASEADKTFIDDVLSRGVDEGILEIISPACVRVWSVYV